LRGIPGGLPGTPAAGLPGAPGGLPGIPGRLPGIPGGLHGIPGGTAIIVPPTLFAALLAALFASALY